MGKHCIHDEYASEVLLMNKIFEQFDEQNQSIFKNWLRKHLEMGKICLTFEKKDGTIRKMNATLSKDEIPVVEIEKNGRKVNESVIAVWDLDKHAWRSVRYDSIMEVNFSVG